MSGIFCVGQCCVDFISVCAGFPKEDSDERVLDYYWQRGGNASNSCSVLALLGAETQFVGNLFTDREGRYIREDFDAIGVGYSNCRVISTEDTGIPTPVSVVLINDASGSRTILHHAKNKPEYAFSDFQKVDFTDCKWIHFEGRPSPSDIRQMLNYVAEINTERAEDERIMTSLELEKTKRQYLDELCQHVDYIFISKEKAKEAGCHSKESAVRHFIKLCKPGGSVICPWGEEGAVAMTTGNSDIFQSKAFPPPRVVDTLGAGDTFNAATIFALGQGHSLQTAVTFGCQVAGAKCGMKGNLGLKDLGLMP